MPLFADPLHDEFSAWILGFAPYGGGDVGEVQLASQVKDGDDDSFFDAWSPSPSNASPKATRRRRRLVARPHATATCGPPRSSASRTTRSTARPSTPASRAFHLQMDTFALLDPPGEPIDVPYEGTTLPAWFLRTPRARARGPADDPRRRRLGLDRGREPPRHGRRRARARLPRPAPRRTRAGQLLIDEGLPCATTGRRWSRRSSTPRSQSTWSTPTASSTSRGASAATWRRGWRRSSTGSRPIDRRPGPDGHRRQVRRRA